MIERAAHHRPQPHGADGLRRDEPRERDVIELDRVSAAELEREGVGGRLQPEPALVIAPTEEHVGSVVVMLRA